MIQYFEIWTAGQFSEGTSDRISGKLLNYRTTQHFHFIRNFTLASTIVFIPNFGAGRGTFNKLCSIFFHLLRCPIFVQSANQVNVLDCLV